MYGIQKDRKLFKIINSIENILCAATLMGLFFTIILQICGRIFAHPFPWTEETTRYLFIYMMFIALASGFNKAESSRVIIFISIFNNKIIQQIAKIIYIVVVIGFFLFMFIYGLMLVHQQIIMNEMGTALMIPIAIIGTCVPLSGILGIIGVIQSLIEYPDKVDIPLKNKSKNIETN